MRLSLSTTCAYLLFVSLTASAAPADDANGLRAVRHRVKRQGEGVIAMAESVSVVDVTTDSATSLIVYRPSETASLALTSIPTPLNGPAAEPSDAASAPRSAMPSSNAALIPTAASVSLSSNAAAASQSSPGSNRVVAAGSSDTSSSANQSSSAGRTCAIGIASASGQGVAWAMIGLLSMALIGADMI